ncbi:MAG TPA: RNA polymerase sigma-70 factor [Sediminibacterium sp.]|nr:RNA polymerase sigma-70 factor [Sediminibacterium sp.]
MREYCHYTNEQLLALLAKEDENAFAEIYSRYWKRLMAIAVNRLKETAVAEDIVHDVFTSLWEGRSQTRVIALENYLAVAVKYAVLNHLRKVHRESAWRRKQEIPVATEATADQSLHYKHILERLQTEVEKLPERCRLVFKYSRQQHLPIREIAREMGISPKTVENQLTKAVRILKLATRSFFFLLAGFLFFI